MNDKEQFQFLKGIHSLLGDAMQNADPEVQDLLKPHQRRASALLKALGGEHLLDDVFDETEHQVPRLTRDVTLHDRSSEGVLPGGISPEDLRGSTDNLIDEGPRVQEIHNPCFRRSLAASRTLARRNNHWWQNWGKHHGYICQTMSFPLSVDEIVVAVQNAETDGMPLRAIGGGWSFSDVALPGDLRVPSRLPDALHVESLARLVPLAETFSLDPALPLIAEIEQPTADPADGPGALVLINPGSKSSITFPEVVLTPAHVDRRYTYLGNGRWNIGGDELKNLFLANYRPIRAMGSDDAGSLAMFNYETGHFQVFFIYRGNGLWIDRGFGAETKPLTLSELLRTSPRIGSSVPRASNGSFSMSLIERPRPVHLINTEFLASSLQQGLPMLLSEEARRVTHSGTPEEPNLHRKHFFHVEAGIKMSDLSRLLGHQSPRLAIEASGGSPGATLAGTLATATHGGEHKTPLLVDRVKAVHLVGPGGVQWWIEGDESIADPRRLMEVYPCLTRNHIITGTNPIEGIRPQDWLNAVVVSMGCMGVIYSVVLEVVPIFGLHEVVIESRWSSVLSRLPFHLARHNPVFVTINDLRRPSTQLDRERLGRELFDLFANGVLTDIGAGLNRYVDIAIDPNPIINETNGTRDWNCWLINRRVTRKVPFEPNPRPKDLIGRIGKSITDKLSSEEVLDRLLQLFAGYSIKRLIRGEWDTGDIGHIVREIQTALANIERLTGSADAINTMLDLLSAPFEASSDPAYFVEDFKAASAIVSGLFSGLLGVNNKRAELSGIVSRVGDIGFPSGGIMGTAIEIAMRPEDAFIFLQKEILDNITQPFFGYVSVRFCPQTQALLGMQQYSPSIMIEVVAYRTESARRFIADLQRRTEFLIREGGLDAMLHWGLECQMLGADSIRAIPAINSGTPSKLEKFISVRSLIGAPAHGENVFDNAFTRRLRL